MVLSQFTAPAYALALLETGSAGRAYLLKERVAGCRRAGPGHPHGGAGGVDDRSPGGGRAHQARSTRRTSDLSWLTPRESEILGEMAQGKSNAAIASSLQVSERAVEKHTNSIFSKARADRGEGGQPAGQGRAGVPERARGRLTPPIPVCQHHHGRPELHAMIDR